MQDLLIDGRSPDQRTLRSHQSRLQQATQASASSYTSAQPAQQISATLGKRDRETSESPPGSNADPLSLLVYAGRIVGRDTQKPP